MARYEPERTTRKWRLEMPIVFVVAVGCFVFGHWGAGLFFSFLFAVGTYKTIC